MNQPLPWWVLPSLAALVLLIFAGALTASCFLGDNTLRTTMFTAAVTLATGVAAYYWGSSASSSKKDDTLAATAAALATSTPATPITTTTHVDAQAGVAETTTSPANSSGQRPPNLPA